LTVRRLEFFGSSVKGRLSGAKRTCLKGNPSQRNASSQSCSEVLGEEKYMPGPAKATFPLAAGADFPRRPIALGPTPLRGESPDVFLGLGGRARLLDGCGRKRTHRVALRKVKFVSSLLSSEMACFPAVELVRAAAPFPRPLPKSN